MRVPDPSAPRSSTEHASWIPIDSPDDAHVRLFTGLTDVALRSLTEPAEGVFVAEGVTVVRRAVDAGYRVLSVLATTKWLRLLDDEHLVAAEVPRYVADDETLRAITGFRVHRGVLALMQRREPTPLSDLLTGARRVVLLEDLKEHTNVGAIVRSAAAFGVDAVAVSPLCADPFYRRAIKVSMGTVFQVPWTVVDDWTAALDQVSAEGFCLAALTPDHDAVDLRGWSAQAPSKVALAFGTEGPGLTPRTLERCDVRLRIPMSGGVDSLNVAAAAAVALFALQPSD